MYSVACSLIMTMLSSQLTHLNTCSLTTKVYFQKTVNCKTAHAICGVIYSVTHFNLAVCAARRLHNEELNDLYS